MEDNKKDNKMNKKRINYEDLILLFWHPKDIPIPEKIEEVITKIRNEGKQQAKKEFLEIIDKYKKYQKESEYEFEDIVVSVEMLKKEVEKK